MNAYDDKVSFTLPFMRTDFPERIEVYNVKYCSGKPVSQLYSKLIFADIEVHMTDEDCNIGSSICGKCKSSIDIFSKYCSKCGAKIRSRKIIRPDKQESDYEAST